MEYNYTRQDKFVEPKEFPLIKIFESFGQLKNISEDESWKKYRLYKLYDKAAPILSQLLTQSKTIGKLELKDLTENAKNRRRKEHLKPVYVQLLELMSEERKSTRQNVQNMEIRILNETNPSKPKEIPDRLSFDARMAEIRGLLRSEPDIQKRIEVIQKHLDGGDPSFLHASILSPDEIVPKGRLRKIRNEYAIKENPTLGDALRDARLLADVVEQRTSELGGTAVEILRENGLEIPITREQFFSYFPAKDEHEQVRQNTLIQKEKNLVEIERKKQEFNAGHPGINMN